MVTFTGGGVDAASVVEGLEGFLFVLEVDPAEYVAHGGVGSGGGEQQRGEELLGDGVPEVGVLEPAAFSCPGSGREPSSHA